MVNLFKNILLFLVSILVSLVVADGLARLFYSIPPATMDTFNVINGDYYRADDELGWLPNPNVDGIHNRSGSFESTFTTNSLGLRDREYALEKPEGVSRIVVVGDSFTWGYGVNDGAIFTEQLERELANWEVINLGVTAFNLKQEAAYFERLGAQFDPDLLLVAFAQNDIMQSLIEFRRMPDPKAANESTADSQENGGVFRGIKDALRSKSALYNITAQVVNTSPAMTRLAISLGIKEPLGGLSDLDNNIVPALKDYPPKVDTAWAELEKDLRDLRDTTSNMGVHLVIAMIPALQSVDGLALRNSIGYTIYEPDDFDFDKPHRMMQALCRDIGIPIVDPLDEFRRLHSEDSPLYLPGDMHFNDRGHRLFARAIREALKEMPLE